MYFSKPIKHLTISLILLILTACGSGGGSSNSSSETTDATDTNESNATVTINENNPTATQENPITVYDEFSTPQKNSFQNIVDNAFANQTDTAGISVAVYQGNTLWKYAKGISSKTAPMTTDTPSIIYSMTKTMTSAVILKLVEDGVIGLTDTLFQALKGHTDLASFDNKKINFDATITSLLNHTSGIKDYVENQSGITTLTAMSTFGIEWKPANLIDLVEDNFADVGDYFYSNTNYILLGMIAEHKTNKSLTQLLADNFFTDLEVMGTLLPRNSTPANLAEPYDDLAAVGGDSEFGNLLTVQPFFLLGLNKTLWAMGGMTMRAQDAAKWGYALYSNRGKALSASSRTILFNSIQNRTYNNYGYGVENVEMTLHGDTVNIYGHGGGGGAGIGYLTILYYSPDLDLSVVVLTNSYNHFHNTAINTFDEDELYEICVALFNAYSN